jgi:hypothetical protein
MIRKQWARRSLVPASGQLGIDRGVLGVLVPVPVFDKGQVGSPFA